MELEVTLGLGLVFEGRGLMNHEMTFLRRKYSEQLEFEATICFKS